MHKIILKKQLIYNLQEQFKFKSKNLITNLNSLIFFKKIGQLIFGISGLKR